MLPALIVEFIYNLYIYIYICLRVDDIDIYLFGYAIECIRCTSNVSIGDDLRRTTLPTTHTHTQINQWLKIKTVDCNIYHQQQVLEAEQKVAYIPGIFHSFSTAFIQSHTTASLVCLSGPTENKQWQSAYINDRFLLNKNDRMHQQNICFANNLCYTKIYV